MCILWDLKGDNQEGPWTQGPVINTELDYEPIYLLVSYVSLLQWFREDDLGFQFSMLSQIMICLKSEIFPSFFFSVGSR